MIQNLRAAIAGVAFDAEDVFDGDRHAEQGALVEVSATGDGSVRSLSLRDCVGGIVAEKRLDFAIQTLDLVEAGLHRLVRRAFAPGEPGGEFGNCQRIKHQDSSRWRARWSFNKASPVSAGGSRRGC